MTCYSDTPRVRMQNVLIHGVSGAGKSMIIEKFNRDHPLESGLDTSLRAIVSMQMPYANYAKLFRGTAAMHRLPSDYWVQDFGIGARRVAAT
jgi:hypothetical protein